MTKSAVRKVFLSSTARDLGPCREAVFRAISAFDDFHVVRMEDFGSRASEADPFCRSLVAECDIFVGLIGYLYGSVPPGGEVSFTEGEHESAVRAGLPRLLFLAEGLPIPMGPETRESDDFFQRQLLFRERIKQERLVYFFNAPEPLATAVVAALRNLEREEERVLPNSKMPARDLSFVTTAYLQFLEERYRYLDFRGFGISDRVPLRLPLVEMYVPLKARVETPDGETWERQRLAGRQPTEEETAAIGLRSKPQPVLDLLGKHDGLIILGDPGAGKSTFLKFLTLILATGRGKDLGLEGRLPVLLPLAAYANALAAGEIRLDRFLAQYAEERGLAVPLGRLLKQEFQRGKVLLLLDGLDEVRDRSLRNTVVERVRDAFTAYRASGNKLILTSRVVGFREVRPAADGLTECMLVDFDDQEIELFVDKWTAAVEKAATGGTMLASQEAARERQELLEAVHRNPGVRSLAANPMLLTILAVMKRQGVTLPERRASLYQTYVETLLQSWNLVRSLAGRSSGELDLAETLKVLAPLALWMHQTSPGVGLVKEWDLHHELERIYRERGSDDPEKATRRFLEDVREHAALLLDRGGRQYGFIHLTFQEYLAAVALAQRGQQDVAPVVEALAAHIGKPAWHEVSLLTVGYLGIVQKRDEAASAVVEALIARPSDPPGEAIALAGRAVADAGTAGVTPACRGDVVSALVATLRASGVEVGCRAEIGKVLAELGDPRIEVTTVDGMEFCLVPASPFQMGSKEEDESAHEDEKPVHLVDLSYDYLIGRYPVTVAQFRQYVEDSKNEPGDPESLRGAANWPVGKVSWPEARAFCAWLTGRWRQMALIAADRVVALPSEAEWEKAARGGHMIPAEPMRGRLGNVPVPGKMIGNPFPDRTYPWGDEADRTRANYIDTGLQTPSTVGCFPLGSSPYGCEEMSGNVWEWTRSLDGSYPYPEPGSTRGKTESPLTSGPRVLRGGSYVNLFWDVRCTVRSSFDPFERYGSDGFRVVVLPLSEEPSAL